jgi:fucose permease
MVIVCVVALEFCMIIWGANYLTLIGGFPTTQAAMLMSLFLGAMLFGRWVGSRLTRRISAAHLLTIMLTLVGLAFPLFWWPPNPLLMIIGLVGVGLGIANLYPLALALAVGAAADQPDRAGARATLASGMAIGVAPLLLAALADRAGFRIAYSVVVVLVIVAASAHGSARVAAWFHNRRAM